jgi:hypothetical protein
VHEQLRAHDALRSEDVQDGGACGVSHETVGQMTDSSKSTTCEQNPTETFFSEHKEGKAVMNSTSQPRENTRWHQGCRAASAQAHSQCALSTCPHAVGAGLGVWRQQGKHGVQPAQQLRQDLGQWHQEGGALCHIRSRLKGHKSHDTGIERGSKSMHQKKASRAKGIGLTTRWQATSQASKQHAKRGLRLGRL